MKVLERDESRRRSFLLDRWRIIRMRNMYW